jgi:hypothetical protein
MANTDKSRLQQFIRDLYEQEELRNRWRSDGTEALFDEYQLSDEERQAFEKIDWRTYRDLGVHPFVGVIRWVMTEDGKKIYSMENFLSEWQTQVKSKTDY